MHTLALDCSAGLRALPAALLGLWNLEISVAEEALVPELASARLLVLARGNGVRVCVLVLALVPKVATLGLCVKVSEFQSDGYQIGGQLNRSPLAVMSGVWRPAPAVNSGGHNNSGGPLWRQCLAVNSGDQLCAPPDSGIPLWKTWPMPLQSGSTQTPGVFDRTWARFDQFGAPLRRSEG